MNEAGAWEEFKLKYDQQRNRVYRLVELQLGTPGIRLTPITANALRAQENWKGNNRIPPDGGWDWSSWVQYFKHRHKKYFDVALWHGEELCGVALGRLSRRNVNVRLEIVEGSTNENHPLKGQVAYIMLAAIETFGAIAGADNSLIIDPVPGAVAHYKQYGYELRSGDKRTPTHLIKRL